MTRIVTSCMHPKLLPQCEYDVRDREIFERHVTKYRKLLGGAKEGIK